MKNKILAFVIFLLVCGCSGQTIDSQVQHTEIRKEEKFKFFYKKFCSDSVFQNTRIIFPLTTETYDIDEEEFLVSKLSMKEWGFMDFNHLGQDYQLKLTVSDKDAIINIQKKETGVSVKYIFEYRNNQWFLVKVIDEST